MPPRRKLPFSGKAKKEQLKLKRQRKNLDKTGDKRGNVLLVGRGDRDEGSGGEDDCVMRINAQPESSASRKSAKNSNRYALQFYKESKEECKERKKEALKSIEKCGEEELEIVPEDYFPSGIDFPKRPPWDFSMSKDELNAKEHKYFREFVKDLQKTFGIKNLGYFELNLETWRQLWRVLEMSDIILVIVDVRYAGLMFPPALYKYVCEELKKDMILVLNKIDLAPAEVVVAWKHYFLKQYPTLRIIMFTSFPAYNLRNGATQTKSGLQTRRRRGKLRMAAEGAQKLYETCKEIVDGQDTAVDLSSWAEKIAQEVNSTYEDVVLDIVTEKVDTSYAEHVKYKSGTLTVGCVGQPNVGKSSLMNAIMGKKVVSVSRTPGHTKHFQTIYLTQNVILCDCPGLVFPSLIPRNLQILIGGYPIAQVREPYSVVKYLAERLDLPKLLNIRHPEDDDTWSAMDICEGWARKRGFFTALAARPDVYRAANGILRMALDGGICLNLKPPGFASDKDAWKNPAEISQVEWIQAKGNLEGLGNVQEDEEGGEEEEEDENSVDTDSSGNKVMVQKLVEGVEDEEGEVEEDESGSVEEEETDSEYSEEEQSSLPETKLKNKFDLLASTED